MKLRLLEPLQAGNLVIPQNTLVSGTGKVQGERLDIVVSSIEYRGNLLPVELAVYDSDGQKGLSVPSSLEPGSGKGSPCEYRRRTGDKHFVRAECRTADRYGLDKGCDAGRQPVSCEEVPDGEGASESGI